MSSESGQEKRDTLAAIAAELRDEAARADTEQYYGLDDAAESMREYAERIEAIDSADAWRSLYAPTVGNAAAMLNALRRIIDCPSLADTAKKGKWQLRRWIECCRKNAIDALSAPPRNCDAMPWRKAFDEWRAKHHPQNPQTFKESYEATVAFMEWFTSSSFDGLDDEKGRARSKKEGGAE